MRSHALCRRMRPYSASTCIASGGLLLLPLVLLLLLLLLPLLLDGAAVALVLSPLCVLLYGSLTMPVGQQAGGVYRRGDALASLRLPGCLGRTSTSGACCDPPGPCCEDCCWLAVRWEPPLLPLLLRPSIPPILASLLLPLPPPLPILLLLLLLPRGCWRVMARQGKPTRGVSWVVVSRGPSPHRPYSARTAPMTSVSK